MNEEELKKEIIKEEKSLTGLSYNIMQSLIKDKEGTKEFQEYIDLTSKIEKLKVQKGKLEAEKNCGKSINEAIINRRKLDLKEELEFIKKIGRKYCFEILLKERIKQLKKEIGGNGE